jgi:uncharacterized protein YecE (DUF72 family)
LLRAHHLANCISDARDWPCWDAVTTDLVYVRLHGHTRTYASSYSGAALARWAARLRRWQRERREVHLYFDNDADGAAPRNALTLLKKMTAECEARRSGNAPAAAAAGTGGEQARGLPR